MASKKLTAWPAGRPYLVGDFYSFHTSPATEFGPKETGRFAALKIVGFKGKSICVGVLNDIFENQPTLEQVKGLSVIRSRRFKSQGEPAIFFVGIDYDNLLGNCSPC